MRAHRRASLVLSLGSLLLDRNIRALHLKHLTKSFLVLLEYRRGVLYKESKHLVHLARIKRLVTSVDQI